MKVPYDLVKVIWRDALTEPAWTRVKKAQEERPLKVLCVGYLLFRDEHRLIVSSGFDEKLKDSHGYTVIPASWVDEVTVVEPAQA